MPKPEKARKQLWSAVFCGLATAAWSLFLWQQLFVVRGGGVPFCAFGGDSCSEVWDSAFASAVHESSGLPVAAWGVVWGLVASVLPALILLGSQIRGLRPAIGWCSLGGLVGVVAMLGISLATGPICESCVVFYLLVGIYVVLLGRPRALGLDGLRNVVIGLAAAYVVLLYPGLQTPLNVMRTGHIAVSNTASSGTATPNARLVDLLEKLPPPALQALSDSLERYRHAKVQPQPHSRHLIGSAGAKVRITDFTDTLCSHCRDLHATFEHFISSIPPDSFSLDSRQYPLDGRCNRHLRPREGEETSCLAAKVRICLEDNPRGFEATRELYLRQDDLNPELVYEIANAFVERSQLEACVEATETERRLADDISYAWLYRPRGTPLVLVNGREGSAYPPFLLALILTEGNANHPIFDGLPAPVRATLAN